ncbi:hypothetical protein ENBRE01_0374 [Enteropsectra breve]|nr:hypothetical protein ENBRE01_0374 [Enteropsectra breve]
MNIADLIVNEIKQSCNDEFINLRKSIKNGKLGQADFSTLIKLLEKDPVKILKTKELSAKEIDLIASAIQKSKIKDMNALIDFIVQEDSKRTPVLLNAILAKKAKIDTTPISHYLSTLESKELYLIHFKILLAVSKSYAHLLTPELIEFCKKQNHPIAKDIVKKHSMEIIE